MTSLAPCPLRGGSFRAPLASDVCFEGRRLSISLIWAGVFPRRHNRGVQDQQSPPFLVRKLFTHFGASDRSIINHGDVAQVASFGKPVPWI